MLEQILDFIHNYFEKQVVAGKFSIRSGDLNVDFLQSGQYYRIKGSVFNDGIHQFGSEEELTDEEFVGEVWALAVPPAVVAIASEVEQWQTKYGEQVNSPFQSESFGGYSYSKASSTNASGRSTSPSWQSVFGSRLNAYRKIS